MINEDRYYGSDLNKFIAKKTSREKTCINIDCVLMKISKRKLRIIESKYSSENIGNQQLKVLQKIFMIFELAMRSHFFNKYLKNWILDVWIVKGDPPYNEVKIIHPYTKKEQILNHSEFKKWLEFDFNLSI